jgi:enoyl-CoA hydratase/carnithine racemase
VLPFAFPVVEKANGNTVPASATIGRHLEEKPMSERISVSVRDGVADVKLNRPDKLNALDQDMFAALAETGRALAGDRSVRSVVLSGEGRAFCAGLDFTGFMAMAGEGSASSTPRRNPLERVEGSPANFAQSAAYVWVELPVPVIAAVHGVAYGGGLQLALGADIRFVAPDARLSVREIQWGLIPDMTGTQTLRHLVRQDVARELTYTGRIVSGTEAVELGLATHVSETPYQAALEIAAEIASRSPDAVRAAKELLTAAPLVSIEEGLALEEKLQRSLIGRPNQIEAVQANLQKRDPKFTDPE